MSKIHYCESCRVKRKWPELPLIREVRCSICRELDECFIGDTTTLPSIQKVATFEKRQIPLPNIDTDVDSEPKEVKRPKRKPIKIEKIKGPIPIDMNIDTGNTNVDNQSKETVDYLNMTADDFRKLKLAKCQKITDDILISILHNIHRNVDKGTADWKIFGIDDGVREEVITKMKEKGFTVVETEETIKFTW